MRYHDVAEDSGEDGRLERNARSWICVCSSCVSCGLWVQVAIAACFEGMGDLEEVHLLLFNDKELGIYEKVVDHFVKEGLLVQVKETPAAVLNDESKSGLASAAPAGAVSAKVEDMEVGPTSAAAATEASEMETSKTVKVGDGQ